MKKITATDLARNLSRILDRLAIDGEGLLVERNSRAVAYLRPAPAEQTALEAMGDLYRTLPEDAAKSLEADIRSLKLRGANLHKGVRDPWAS